MQSNLPLSPDTKSILIAELRSHTGDDAFLSSLITAAQMGCQFPEPIHTKLSPLQKALDQFSGNDTVLQPINEAIKIYFKTEAFDVFCGLLNQEAEKTNWKSRLLTFLAKTLTITLPEQYLVEVQVAQGKAHWRVLNQQGEVVYDRATVKGRAFTFDPEQSWRVSIEEFLQFKHSGKRNSNVVISEAQFKICFGPDNYTQNWAANAYGEIKRLGMITTKGKLSQGFRHLSGVTLEPNVTIIPKEHIQPHVIDRLYPLLNNQNVTEVIKVNDKVLFSKFRAEHSRKHVAGTGYVTNQVGKTKPYSTQLWDVGIHADLGAHYNADHVVQALDCDHVPSADCLRTFSRSLIKLLQDHHAQLATQLEVLQKVLADKITQQHELEFPEMQLTREQEQKLKMKFEDESAKIAKIEKDMKSAYDLHTELTLELDGKNWWTIAIPRVMHKQGLTYKESGGQQAKLVENPFHDEVEDYLNVIETRPQDVGLQRSDFIKALGAFRTLFHFQLKFARLSDSKTLSGFAPGHFFESRKNLITKVDTLFNQRMRRHLRLREDLQEKTKEPEIKKALFAN